MTDDLLTLTIGNIAHGGHCVARIPEGSDAGRVLFVRHTLPGETVRARITERGKVWRADALEILEASPDRVPSAWPEAGPGGVGGGELAHVSLDGQHRWKATVVAEQLKRLGGIEREVTVEGAPGDAENGGLAYRTRMDLLAGENGKLGMRRFRSHDVIPLTHMPLATERVQSAARLTNVWDKEYEPGVRVRVVAPESGCEPVILVDGSPRGTVIEEISWSQGARFGESAMPLTYRLSASGFWQVHREAPSLLVEAVTEAAGECDGINAFDLYCGAGLFTVPLAHLVGENGRVFAVEGSLSAANDVERTTKRLRSTVLHGPVEKVIAGLDVMPSLIVLDPPRVGAGRVIVKEIATHQPDRVVYVACDPAALGRDTAYFAEEGYTLTGLRAFDLFPMTHHVECVATFQR
ncbi:MAG: TRAM domain-containing protein [Cellulomonadaceae bacterium]|jgi:tRNA/tmRNA/rRNA uracil-C5-methylase (TrmA/RlmC/RlmD family)|nr:TRAM domain-containing protein [Cellulomonadaceae bacterium]